MTRSIFIALKRCILLLFTFILLPELAVSAGTKVIYPDYQSISDTRFNDLIEILDTALKETQPEFGPYELVPSKTPMNEVRWLIELKRGSDLVNVAWSSTSEEKETELLPIRIPLRKGLLGYRIALINKDKQDLIDQIKTIENLRKMTVGQGQGWGDILVYESNGIPVITSEYESLFRMVASDRFNLFPRGIGEVFNEYATFSKDTPNLAIEKNLLIYYPWPYYFFFNANNVKLKERIEMGLRKMINNGSFDAIFKKYNGAAIEKANFKRRRIIKLNNNLLPKETPLNDQSLWFDPKNY